MKHYNTNKKIVIAVLSAAVVLLAGGLWVYLDSMNSKAPPTPIIDSIEQTQDDIDIPKIQIPESKPQDTPAAVTQPETQIDNYTTATTGEQSKPSDGKPKTQDEAAPPEIPATVKEEHTIYGAESPNVPPSSAPVPAKPENNVPKSGGKNNKGDIYVPGFGWIPDSGEKNTQGTAPNAGTGEIIGTM